MAKKARQNFCVSEESSIHAKLCPYIYPADSYQIYDTSFHEYCSRSMDKTILISWSLLLKVYFLKNVSSTPPPPRPSECDRVKHAKVMEEKSKSREEKGGDLEHGIFNQRKSRDVISGRRVNRRGRWGQANEALQAKGRWIDLLLIVSELLLLLKSNREKVRVHTLGQLAALLKEDDDSKLRTNWR